MNAQKKLTITLELSSSFELEAVERALELFAETEMERIGEAKQYPESMESMDTTMDAVLRDEAIAKAAIDLLASMRGGR